MKSLTDAVNTSSSGRPTEQREAASESETEAPILKSSLAAGSFLEAAARRVVANVPSWAGNAIDRGEVLAEIELIGEALETADARPVREQLGTGRVLLCRRLVELLRGELVRGLAAAGTTPPGDAILDLFSRLELVRAALDPDWHQYFSSGVSGVNGQDLIVEVAHDFRSPLTSIMFLAETLRRGQSGEINEHQRHQLGIIYSAALGLVSVASDVIEMVRGAVSLEDQEAAPFSVGEVLEGVRDMVRPMAEEKHLALQVVPPRNDLRMGFPVPLSRALLNLTTNAIKFTDDGFVEVVARARGRDRMEFAVRDTGRGVNSEAVRTLYHPFRRARTESGFHFSGTGLGLAICRKMVEAMDSELKLDSRAGWGTRFSFELYLPIAPDA
jgi:signal transduction histidine kinase